MARIVDYTLKDLDSLLSPNSFYRLSRSLVVNRAIIDDIEKLHFIDPFKDKQCIVNSRRREDFLNWYSDNVSVK